MDATPYRAISPQCHIEREPHHERKLRQLGVRFKNVKLSPPGHVCGATLWPGEAVLYKVY